jgi:hypothetical protein
MVGAHMAPPICARFGFTPAETRLIIGLVTAHGEPYALFKEVTSLPPLQQLARTSEFEAAHLGSLFPLLILALGDLVTSHLQTHSPEKYKGVLDFYRSWLQCILLP